MSAHAVAPPRAATPFSLRSLVHAEPGYQAFMMLRLAFVVAPIAFGLDKFFNVLVNWTQYLAPWINDILPGNAHDGMHIVGVIEIVAGLVVLVKPRYGAPLVAAWLFGIVVNLLSLSGYYDVALRDFGLFLAAVALARLAVRYAAGEPAPAGGAR